MGAFVTFRTTAGAQVLVRSDQALIAKAGASHEHKTTRPEVKIW